MALEKNQVKRSTMAEIAKEAGVSTTTVSKVLNELPGVGASTRARIRQVIEQVTSLLDAVAQQVGAFADHGRIYRYARSLKRLAIPSQARPRSHEMEWTGDNANAPVAQ